MGVVRGRDGTVFYSRVHLVTSCGWRVNRMSVSDRKTGTVSDIAQLNE